MEESRPYDEKGYETCPRCEGNMDGVFDEKTAANERVCRECGHTIIDGFGNM